MMKPAMGLTIAEFSSKTFLQRCCLPSATTERPESVLSFFFGADYYAAADAASPGDDDAATTPVSVRNGSCLSEMSGLWYGGGPAYDALCQPFATAVRLAGGGGQQQQLVPGAVWDETVRGLVAQLLLTDQLARNIFRGSSEALAYETVSLDLARRLAQQALGVVCTTSTTAAAGELFPPYLSFTATALMHSEELPDHVDLCLPLIDFAKASVSVDDSSSSSSSSLSEWWNFQKSSAEEHKQVIQRFGRYPHRNELKQRESTRDELEWLADEDNLPGWAKSMR